ncbi:MAG: BatD family protein [Gammaproteobacteria bacterium]|nr:BatD family protein [Gammaproteobacteria bacterium]
MVNTTVHRLQFAVFLFALLFAGATQAAVIASIDRANVELNESFTLKVTVDTAIDVEPDASALEEDFLVGTRSQLSNTTIVNGQISRSRTWTYVLMAKREGNLIIPPVRIANEQSEPVSITVTPPSTNIPGEADIFVTTEVDHDESFVQAQVLYRVKVYRAVATRQPRLSEPSIEGVEVLIESAGEERSYESILNGKAYNVVERVYALFPQESGTISIAPARFEARVLRNGRITGRKIFESGAIDVVVNPIPPPPPDYPDAVWFPAKSVVLSEDWSREPGTLPAGEPITRHITVTAVGQLSTQIPVIEPANSDNIKVYPDKPEFRDVAEPTGIRAVRRDQYAMIGVTAGEVVLPDVNLPWWNIDAAEWQVATLPGTTLSISPSANAVLPQPAPVEPAADDTGSAVETQIVYVDFWLYVSAGLAGVWLMTVIAWWWSRRPVSREPKEPAPPPIHKQQARWLKAARKAAQAGDAAGIKSSLLEWGRLEWPDKPPRSIGEFSNRVAIPLSTQLQAMCSASYGPGDREWSGEELAKSLRSISVLREAEPERLTDTLPPLSPVNP